MKQKELEIMLQKIPEFNSPKPQLEQYLTPAPIAADLLFTATQYGDIENKIVVDLGCGTGIFSVGAYLCGAAQVVGFDIDCDCINQARDYAFENNLNLNFMIERVRNVNTVCDTVIMNPPFGAQKSNIRADRAFVEKGFQISAVIYFLCLSKTVPFIEKMVSSLGGEIDFKKDYVFRMKHTFEFHEKKSQNFDVTLLRIPTKK
jgi:putative methylase